MINMVIEGRFLTFELNDHLTIDMKIDILDTYLSKANLGLPKSDNYT